MKTMAELAIENARNAVAHADARKHSHEHGAFEAIGILKATVEDLISALERN